MQLRELSRAIAAFAVFSLGIALLLISLLVVVFALAKSPIFVFVGFGGMAAAAIIVRIAHTKIAPHQLP